LMSRPCRAIWEIIVRTRLVWKLGSISVSLKKKSSFFKSLKNIFVYKYT
jgi:hypothetical protein